jgi:hypothetical protein
MARLPKNLHMSPFLDSVLIAPTISPLITASAFVGTNQAEFNQPRCYPYPAECILRFSAFCYACNCSSL